MGDLISRKSLLDNLNRFAPECYNVLVNSLIEKEPAVDAVPVVHGEWVDNGIPDSMLSKCNVCGFPCGAYSFNFCPNCGADMRKDKA